ncbi:Uncharacterized protein PCOAH_00006620 [Plasmodium coatneyi]|uniref:C-CAP/cofactor C-like domain-containing protein n=1 Tax=Plasmodium coatneyi TaxID=208452 RepID=A0A1B1DUU1_9APIC|nr:Uncharacterized protein PCOAH_00006620 [Plasmodium coatneyi]ANQ06548.1 Uncharacterized protein PCOAH_00006620 [Plasmodium coatneyi]
METNKGDVRTRADKETNSLFLRKEIFDHAVIYTTNKIEESVLLIYLKNLYEHFKNSKGKKEDGGSVHHDDQMYVTLDSWLSYNEAIKGQDNICSANFTHNVCKSLWILLSITLQSVKKKNNVNGQKTIFNASLEELHKQGGDRRGGEGHQESDKPNWRDDTSGVTSLSSSHTNGSSQFGKVGIHMDSSIVADVAPNKHCGGGKDGAKGDSPADAWNENWLDEEVCIELVIFFIILQFLKIDNVKRKYDKNLSEDSWPHFGSSPRSISNSSSGLGGVVNGVGSSSLNGSNSPSSGMSKSNLSDFFHFCGKNYKHFLKTYLIAFLCATDIVNSSTLTDTPLYFKSEHLFLLDFIIDTNDHTNVYEKYLQKNEPKILYKTKEILTWLLSNLCMTDCVGDEMAKGLSHNGQSLSSTTPPCSSNDTNGPHYGIENIKNDIFEIKNMQGKTIYITSDKNIVNISNCKECNIFIFSKVEYLKIHLCVNCCIISLAIEMISTFFNSKNLDVHLVTRSLKIENVIDTNVYVYTETNIIIFGDTRNIQLAPYNILNANQGRCLRKSRISFNSKKCDLFAFPLKCKTSLFHSVGLSGGANFPLLLKSPSGALSRCIDKSTTTSGGSTTNDVGSTEEKNEGTGGKPFDMANLSSSFTDYVYYLLSPSKFFLTEFPTPSCSSEGGDETAGGEQHEEDCSNHLDDTHYNSDGKQLPPGEGTYKNTQQSQKYECLYLPEVYKNAIENQDDHILQFLSFMDSIHLSGVQMQKVKKILTYKLYAYLKTSKKAFRVLTDFVSQEQDVQGGP